MARKSAKTQESPVTNEPTKNDPYEGWDDNKVKRVLNMWKSLGEDYLSHERFHDGKHVDEVRKMVKARGVSLREQLRRWEVLARRALPSLQEQRAARAWCEIGRAKLARVAAILDRTPTVKCLEVIIRASNVEIPFDTPEEEIRESINVTMTLNGAVPIKNRVRDINVRNRDSF